MARNARNPSKVSKLEQAKQQALQQHLRDTLANATVPKVVSIEKRKRKPGPKNSLPVDSSGVVSPSKPLALAPRMQAYNYFVLGYSCASIARAMDLSYDTVLDWRDKDGWAARRDAAMVEADTNRAAQIGALKERGFVASVKVLEHVTDALDAVSADSGLPASYDAEELRDFATAIEKVTKPAYPNEGLKVGVQVVNIADAIEESRRFDPPRPRAEIVDAEPA